MKKRTGAGKGFRLGDGMAWLSLIVAIVAATAPASAPAQVLNPPPPAVAQAQAMARRAGALEENGQWTEALQLRREMVQRLETELGPRAPETDHARRTIADSLMSQGRYPEARKVLEVCLEVRTNALGTNHLLVGDILNRLGDCYRREGLATNALPFFTRARDIFARLRGQEAELAGVILHQGEAAADLADLFTAEGHFSRALRLVESTPDWFKRAKALNGLADVHRRLGRLPQAVAEHRQALTLCSNLPPTHPFRLLTANHLANALREDRQLPEAIALYQDSLGLLTARRGPDDLEVLFLRAGLARALRLNQDQAGALAEIEDVLQRLQASGRSTHPLHDALLRDQADSLQEMGDLDGAVTLYARLLGSARPDRAADSTEELLLRERLARLELARGDLSRAHDTYVSILNARRRNAAREPR
ncbi:MAG: tetratricopeptide repeat protein, partial [Verrucomicrobia bacterium]|nr:tetratricopeptide repeat protein [Verrucomicrobiota bacterium]